MTILVMQKIKNIGLGGVIMYRDHDKNNLRIENLDYVSRAEFNKTRIEKKRKKYRPQRYKNKGIRTVKLKMRTIYKYKLFPSICMLLLK